MAKKEKYVFKGTGLTTKERRWAKSRFDDYQDNYYIDNFSDNQLLEELVFFETLQKRYKETIEKISKSSVNSEDKEPITIPPKILDALKDNLNQILSLKKQLGLLNQEDVDESKAEKQKMKKFRKWCDENQLSREVKCPHCSKMILLKMRTEKYDVHGHSFFWDKYFLNKPAFKLFFENKITKLELAKIMLGEDTTIADYIDWILNKLEDNIKFQEFKKRCLNQK